MGMLPICILKIFVGGMNFKKFCDSITKRAKQLWYNQYIQSIY